MKISLENRKRTVLLLFFILDHMVWIYGDLLENVSLFYTVLSEGVRIFALIASFSNGKILDTGVITIMAYSAIMGFLNFYGSPSVSFRTGRPMPNFLWFRNESTISVDSGGFATFFYIYVMLSTYLFAAKHISKEILDKK